MCERNIKRDKTETDGKLTVKDLDFFCSGNMISGRRRI
jgi:hypothetical protein